MRKFALFLLSLFVLASFIVPQEAYAANPCAGVISGVGNGVTIPNGASSHTIKMDVSGYNPDKEYSFGVDYDTSFPRIVRSPTFKINDNFSRDGLTINNGVATWIISHETALANDGRNLTVFMDGHTLSVPTSINCEVGRYKTASFSQPQTKTSCQLYISQQRGGKTCYQSGCLYAGGVNTTVTAENMRNPDGSVYNGRVQFRMGGAGQATPWDQSTAASNGSASIRFDANHATTYSVVVVPSEPGRGPDLSNPLCTTFYFQTSTDGSCQNLCGDKINAYEGEQTVPNFELCSQTEPGSEAATKCMACIDGSTLGGKQGIWTAIGCISTEPTGIIQTLIRLALGLGGGVTLLLILAGAFRLSVSQGDPKAAEEAKEQITSAVIGLLFIIFSVVMLRFIGIQVLQIPGFGG